jgi:hypothetical protein
MDKQHYDYWDALRNNKTEREIQKIFRVSKQGYDYSLNSMSNIECNYDISPIEIKNYLWTKPRPKKFCEFSYFISNNDYRLTSILFEKTYVPYDYDDNCNNDDIYINQYEYESSNPNCGLYNVKYDNFYPYVDIKTLSSLFSDDKYNQSRPMKSVAYILQGRNNGEYPFETIIQVYDEEFKKSFLDPLTIYNIYSARLSCNNLIQDYAKNKTINNVEYILDILDDPKLTLLKNLYLISSLDMFGIHYGHYTRFGSHIKKDDFDALIEEKIPENDKMKAELMNILDNLY